MLVLANGAPAGGTRIWGHVLVLANGQRLARIQSRQPGLSIREMQATMFGSNIAEHGGVLVLANGGGEELGSCAVRDAACARARKESQKKRKCARAR